MTTFGKWETNFRTDLYFQYVNPSFPILREESGPRDTVIVKAIMVVMAAYSHGDDRMVSSTLLPPKLQNCI